MRRLFAFLVLLFSTAPAGFPQSPPPRDSSRARPSNLPPSGTGRIAGRVVSAESTPLRNARVSLTPASDENPLVLADGDGRFEFTALRPGRYIVSAAKSGFASSTESARNPRFRPVAVNVGDGEAVTGVTVELARGAAIAGRLVDDLGDPIANTAVFVEQLVEVNGARSARERRSVQTNDNGEYRVGSLPEGEYVVSRPSPPAVQIIRNGQNVAVIQPQLQAVRANTPLDPSNFGPPRTFFPDVATLAEAEAIAVKAGEEHGSVDMIGPRPQPPLTDVARAQDSTPIARDPAARMTSTIRGRVFGPAGPLPGAEVRVTSDAIRPLPAAYTDGLGQYEFLNLPAGVYTVSARKGRYIPGTFGQTGPASNGSRISLGVDERRERTDITLSRTSAIAGQLTDEYGDPVEGVTVRPHRIRFVSGRRRLVDVSGASSSRTDDLGRYRLAGLQPGQYIVAAYVGQLVGGQPGGADIPGYATTYFPGTPNPPESRLVAVSPSQDLDGANFSLSRIPTATVSGVAMTSAGEPITGGLILSSSRRSDGVATTPVGAYIQPDGSFEFRNVPPGQYVIQAYRGRLRSSAEGEFAAVPVTVSGSAIRGLVVQTSAGSTVSGRFTFEAAGAPISRNLSLTAIPSDADLAPLDANFARADIHDDWTFEMSGISGPRRLRLLQAPRGWALKRILVGGVDATDVPLPFGARNQSLSDVEVVLTDRISEIAGTVTDDRSRPVADSRVVAFAADPDLWYERSRFAKITASGADGAFVVRDLPPGVYFVAAVDRRRASEDNGEWLNPDLLESLASGALRITLAEGERVSASPRLAGR